MIERTLGALRCSVAVWRCRLRLTAVLARIGWLRSRLWLRSRPAEQRLPADPIPGFALRTGPNNASVLSRLMTRGAGGMECAPSGRECFAGRVSATVDSSESAAKHSSIAFPRRITVTCHPR
jgi:hypothetical protein